MLEKKKKNFHKADSLFMAGLQIAKKHNYSRDITDLLYNICENLDHQKRYNESIVLRKELYEMIQKTGEPNWLKSTTLELASNYFILNDIAGAKKFLRETESIDWLEPVSPSHKISYLVNLGNLTYSLGDYKRSAAVFMEMNNSSEQEAINSTINDIEQMRYVYQKQQDSLTFAKQKEIDDLLNEKQQQESEHKLLRQKIVMFISIIGLLLISIFSVFLFKATKQKELANKELIKQKHLVTEKNKEITDSITYAKRIQQSLLPPLDLLEILLPQHFLVYMPKDIVSGDFFWAKKLNAHEIFLAVADCTGHGVPGAMMSALSIQNLNELSTQTRSASELLSLLNINLKNTLNQDQEGFSKDGLDICLCKINTKERKISYSGANRSLQIFNEKGLKVEVKATKTGIAGHTLDSQKYAEHEVTLEDNDMVVMSTDGFADQFGGPENKKITTKRFKEWMSEIVSINDKKTELEQRFKTWKGSKDQIDDVCVLGFKI
ncbi:MAG: SpoIIE family protein phosphatase [Sphingobacteriaceae bacterium]|nr:SpoIIE family protein phosphatase [Sphingobacteriaceae bacterium]